MGKRGDRSRKGDLITRILLGGGLASLHSFPVYIMQDFSFLHLCVCLCSCVQSEKQTHRANLGSFLNLQVVTRTATTLRHHCNCTLKKNKKRRHASHQGKRKRDKNREREKKKVTNVLGAHKRRGLAGTPCLAGERLSLTPPPPFSNFSLRPAGSHLSATLFAVHLIASICLVVLDA